MATVVDGSAADTQTKQLATSFFPYDKITIITTNNILNCHQISTSTQAPGAPKSQKAWNKKGKRLKKVIPVCHLFQLPSPIQLTFLFYDGFAYLEIYACRWNLHLRNQRVTASSLNVQETWKCELGASSLTSLSFSFLKAKVQIIIVFASHED